jgi:hypothetical protein
MASFRKKMGLLQLGLLTAGAALLVAALAVKAERSRAAERVPLTAMAEPAGVPGSRGHEGDAMPGYEGEPGVADSGMVDSVEIDPDSGVSDAGVSFVPPDGDAMVMPPAMQPAACDFAAWIGKPVDESAVKATGRPYRILPPGAMMTMDHSPDRINVETDDAGIVVRVFCG